MGKSETNYDINEDFSLEYFLPKSNSICKKGDKFIFSFLHESRAFRLPFNWHPDELNKGTRLWKLNLHYMEYLDEVNNHDFELLIDDWINSNPAYMKDYALDNWNSYALSIRSVVWMHQYSLRKINLSKKFTDKFLNSLNQQLHFLYNNLELDIGGNHIIKNIKALLWAGNFFSSQLSKKWLLKGERLLDCELHKQILNDGMHYELSPSYHCQVFIDLLDCLSALNNEALKTKLRTMLSRMALVISDLSFSDGYIAQFSDGGYHMAPSPIHCLRIWEGIIKNKTFQNRIVALQASGYYGLHNKDMEIIIDCGKIGSDSLPAHGHGDIFSYELCVNKKRIIIDPGVYEYNSGEKRSHSRSTKAHNTVTLDDYDQGEFYSAFRLGRRANVHVNCFNITENGFLLTAIHDGFKKLDNRPFHQRTFKVSGKQIQIKDMISEGASQSVKSRILIHPDCKILAGKNHIQINFDTVEVIIQTESKIDVLESRWFPDFGLELPCNQIVMDYGFAPCHGEYLINITHKHISNNIKLSPAQENLT